MPASIHALPEALLGEVLALCGRREGPSVTLVCRLWRLLFYQQRSLWRSLELQFWVRRNEDQLTAAAAAESFVRRLALLYRVAPLVEEACIAGSSVDAIGQLAGAENGLADCLAALLAATGLTSLELDQPALVRESADALAALSSLRQLRRCGDIGGHDAAALPALRQLQGLTVQDWTLTNFMPAVPRLSPLLTSLKLHSISIGEPMPPLRPLTRLSQLRELEVIEDAVFGNAGLELLPVTAFPAITRLTLCAGSRLKTAGGIVFHKLPGLTPAAPVVAQLRRRLPADTAAWLLMCAHMALSEAADLPTLLAGLGVQLHQLSRLLFNGVGPPPPETLAAWPQLSAATRLILNISSFPLDVLLPLLPRLQVMNLTSLLEPATGEPLLAPLAHCATGLHTLQLVECGAAELPQGPYLQSLQTLVYQECRLGSLPPCLTSASRLEELELQRNKDLLITQADVDSVLTSLPALRLLWLDERQLAPGAAERLQALTTCRPQLQLNIRKEDGDALPEAS